MTENTDTDTDSVQLEDGKGPVVYDGTNDSVLPEHLQLLLGNLPDEQAKEMREQLSGETVTNIEAEFASPSWGAAPKDFPGVWPPTADLTAIDPKELWDASKIEVSHIAEMFKTLADAGMPAEMAMAVIAVRMPTTTMVPPAQIQTAGPRIEGVTSPAGTRLAQNFGATIVPAAPFNGV